MSHQAYQVLENLINEKKLCDLHTHLTGMGNAEFWIDFMRSKLPLITNSRYIEIYANVATVIDTEASRENAIMRMKWVENILSTNRLIALSKSQRDPVDYSDDYRIAMGKNLASEQVNYVVHSFPGSLLLEGAPASSDLITEIQTNTDIPFSYDVIFSTQALEKAGFDTCNVSLKPLMKRYIVFNANLQQFELSYGISCKELIHLADVDHKVMDLLKGSFSVPQHQCKLKFTPEFYPQRFSLKEALYSQYLIVLDYLLEYVSSRYWENGVSYAEFSVTCRHLIFKPWLARHLLLPYSDRSDSALNKVTFHYLAAINRIDILLPFGSVWRRAYSPEEAALFLFQNKDMVQRCFQERKLYSGFLDELSLMEKAFEVSDFLHTRVVGMDFMGDELGFPYCPFWLQEFTSFANRRMDRQLEIDPSKIPCFGLRAHAGEVSRHYFVYDPHSNQHTTKEYLAYDLHKQIVQEYIKRMVNQTHPSHHRVGHGVCLMDDVECEDKALMEYIIANGKDLLIEVNLSSNSFLLNYNYETHPVRKIPDDFAKVVFCSDNDGVFDLKCNCGRNHKSLAAEYCIALQLKLLDANNLETSVKQGWLYKFRK